MMINYNKGRKISLLQVRNTFADKVSPVIRFFRPRVCQPEAENSRSAAAEEAGILKTL